MKYKALRIPIFVLVLFGAITTIAGGVGLITRAIATPLEWLQSSPFVDYTIPGLALAIIVGGSVLLAVLTILTGREIGVLASAFAGLVMMIFEIVEVVVIDPHAGSSLALALSMQTFYFALGLAIFVLATTLWM
ncbi:MAG: hypothetical protein ACXVCM_23025, partial [Ktedonobacteraceae bacterium]